MLNYRARTGTNLVEITVEGHVSKEEFDRVAAALEEAIDEHGSVRVLNVIKSFEGMDVAAFWEDIRFGFRHLNDISCVAVVTDTAWIKWWSELVEPFISAEVKVFDANDLAAARAWLRPTTAS